jgi:hypothetical protein
VEWDENATGQVIRYTICTKSGGVKECGFDGVLDLMGPSTNIGISSSNCELTMWPVSIIESDMRGILTGPLNDDKFGILPDISFVLQ